MKEIKYMPIGRVYLSERQKRDITIRRLRRWVAVLAVADAIYTILAGMIIYGMVAR